MSKPLWRALLKLATEEEPTLSCQECYALMDQYADLLLQGTDPCEVMLLVKEHLEQCHGCEEMFETLIYMVNEAEPPPTSEAL